MFSKERIRRALLFFVSGKAASGLLGVLWLAALIRTCDQQSLGVYLAFLSLFEVTQLLSSFGLYSFVQRYLPQSYVATSRAEFSRTLIILLLSRGTGLCAASIVVLLLWQPICAWQGWPAGLLNAWVAVGFIVLEGAVRYLDSVFESLVHQGFSQLISVLRNILRLTWLLLLSGLGATVNVESILLLELSLAGLFLLVGLFTLYQIVSTTAPHESGSAKPQLHRAISYSIHTYAALAAGQVCSVDAMRLMVGHFCGPNVVALYGLAQAVADIVRRYMPMQLLQGFVRSVIIAKLVQHGDSSKAVSQAALLHKLNFLFLSVAAGMTAVVGDQVLLLLAQKTAYKEATPYLVGFMLLVVAQALRILLAMIATIKEDGRSILVATIVSCSGLLIAAMLIPTIGPWGGIIGLLLSECAYILVLRSRLSINFRDILGNGRGYIVITLACFSATALARILGISQDSLVQFAVNGCLFLLVLHLLLFHIKAFTPEEREQINNVLPAKVFVW